MSKFLNLFGPALGGTAVVLGGAYILADQFVADMPAPARGTLVPAAEAESAAGAEARLAAAEAPAPAQQPQVTAEPAATEPAATEPAAAEPVAVVAQPAGRQGLPMPDVRPISFAAADRLGLGRAATAEEIAAWDVDVLPDGTGLPEGAGSVEAGEALFSERCAACHGEFAEGVGNWPELAGGEDTLDDADPVKTVGSYWPYLSTAWDYIHRSMPFGEAQSLTVDETYAITAYILYSNYLVEEDFTLTRENFLDIEMPNADGFFIDDRATAEYPRFRAEPCMEDCKETVEITMRATVLDVTPEDTAEAEEASASPPAEAAEQAPDPVETAAAPAADPAPATEAQPAADDPGPEAALDPELVAAGEKVFRKCKSCHQLGDNAKNRSGPVLNGVVGAPVGAVKDFRYSTVFKEAHDAGAVWDTATLSAFLANPRAAMKGTKMSFSGLKNDADVEAVIEYLRSFGEG